MVAFRAHNPYVGGSNPSFLRIEKFFRFRFGPHIHESLATEPELTVFHLLFAMVLTAILLLKK